MTLDKSEFRDMLVELLHENLSLEITQGGWSQNEIEITVRFDEQLICWDRVTIPVND